MIKLLVEHRVMQHKAKITNDFPRQFESLARAHEQRRKASGLPDLFEICVLVVRLSDCFLFPLGWKRKYSFRFLFKFSQGY